MAYCSFRTSIMYLVYIIRNAIKQKTKQNYIHTSYQYNSFDNAFEVTYLTVNNCIVEFQLLFQRNDLRVNSVAQMSFQTFPGHDNIRMCYITIIRVYMSCYILYA